MAIQGERSDTFRVTLTVDGIDYGVWDKKTGGRVGSDPVKYKPGGMEPEVSLGGTPTLENITLQRNYRLVRDHTQALPKLLARVGKGECVVKQLPLDEDGNAYGTPIVIKGKLQDVAPPDHDSESTAAAMLEVVISPSGPATAVSA